jgi:Uma2 family endonuclease
MSAVLTPTSPATPFPTPRMTADEFAARHAGDRVEFLFGRVVELPMPQRKHGMVANMTAFYLTQHVIANGIGRVATHDSFVRVPTTDDPTKVRGADICYFSYARVPKGVELDSRMDVSPELIVEVKSPSDLWTEVFTKVEEYLANGVLAVVVLDPDRRTASVCRPGVDQQDFGAADTLVLPDVLPGFAVPVARLFD